MPRVADFSAHGIGAPPALHPSQNLLGQEKRLNCSRVQTASLPEIHQE